MVERDGSGEGARVRRWGLRDDVVNSGGEANAWSLVEGGGGGGRKRRMLKLSLVPILPFQHPRVLLFICTQ